MPTCLLPGIVPPNLFPNRLAIRAPIWVSVIMTNDKPNADSFFTGLAHNLLAEPIPAQRFLASVSKANCISFKSEQEPVE